MAHLVEESETVIVNAELPKLIKAVAGPLDRRWTRREAVSRADRRVRQTPQRLTDPEQPQPRRTGRRSGMPNGGDGYPVAAVPAGDQQSEGGGVGQTTDRSCRYWLSRSMGLPVIALRRWSSAQYTGSR
jgi:hypothetical protein